MRSRVLMQGSEAIVEASIAAGCTFFVGYPITPINEILELAAEKSSTRDLVFFQAEDEIAVINVAIGASWAGRKVLVATSGPGFSLMQEGIGYAVMTETPIVIVDAMRTGPATGQATKTSQGDLLQAIWGRHGDQAVIVLTPNSISSLYEATIKAFNYSEKYRVPVIIAVEEAIIHLRESIDLSNIKLEVLNREKSKTLKEPPFGGKLVPPMPEVGEGFNILVTGSTHDEYGVRHTSDPQVHRRLVERLLQKIYMNKKEIVDYEVYSEQSPEYLIVSIGVVSRASLAAAKVLRAEGVKVGVFIPKTIWPFPCTELREVVEREDVKKILVPEMNLKQLYYIVKACLEGVEVRAYNKIGGGIPIYPSEIVKTILEWRQR